MILVDLSKYEFDSEFIMEAPVQPTAQGRARDGEYGNKYNPHLGQRKDFIISCSDQLKECKALRFKMLGASHRYIHSMEIVYFEPLVKGTEEHEPSLSSRDVDNMEKFVMDALQGICYKNDNRVWFNSHAKLRSNTPKVSIIITNHRRRSAKST